MDVHVMSRQWNLRVETNADAGTQWDHCLSTLLIRSTLGASFGVIFSVLLFKRRAWPVWAGLGFGAGRAWEECDSVRSIDPTPFDVPMVF